MLELDKNGCFISIQNMLIKQRFFILFPIELHIWNILLLYYIINFRILYIKIGSESMCE